MGKQKGWKDSLFQPFLLYHGALLYYNKINNFIRKESAI